MRKMRREQGARPLIMMYVMLCNANDANKLFVVDRPVRGNQRSGGGRREEEGEEEREEERGREGVK